MADLERERFEEDVPVRSVSEMPSNLRPSESVDRRQSLPADLNKKIEKSKVKPRLSEGGKQRADTNLIIEIELKIFLINTENLRVTAMT